MNIKVSANAALLGEAAGRHAAAAIKAAIEKQGYVNIILATGASQFETLKTLVADRDIQWGKVTMFHLDEYIGLPVTHKASFRKYLTERFIEQVPSLKAAVLINGETDPRAECERLSVLIQQHPIDVALVGIGENAHLAFNDPPADFDTEKPYIVVTLDEPCRKQQLNEGWFNSFEEVPQQAISMSIRQILKSSLIICSVPDERKAVAVKNSLEQEISNLYPASILQTHPDCHFYLDTAAASLLHKV